MHKRILIPLLTMFLAAAAFGQDKARQLADTIAPFVDEQTVAVGVADLSAIDPDAVKKWLVETARKLGAPDPRMDDPELVFATKWLADFRKAGGKQIFTVVNPADVPFVPAIVPLEEGADAKAIASLLATGTVDGLAGGPQPGKPQAVVIGKAVVMAIPAVLDRLRQQKAVARPELVTALAAAGDAPVRAVIIPSSDIRRVLAELMPKLPDAAGGGSTEPISKGLSWAAGGASFPPAASVHVVLQCQDAASAKAMLNLIGSVYAAAKNSGEFKEVNNMDQVFAALTPAVNNDRLVLDVNPDKIVVIMAPSVAAARERANRIKSASNLRQIGQGCFLYANDKKEFPPDLGTMVTAVDLIAEVFVSPSSGKTVPKEIRSAATKDAAKWVNANADYVYLGAGIAMNDPKGADRIIAYEKPEIHHNAGMNVLYGDGHVEWVADVAATIKLIEQQRGK